jgi:hypothetical protein
MRRYLHRVVLPRRQIRVRLGEKPGSSAPIAPGPSEWRCGVPEIAPVKVDLARLAVQAGDAYLKRPARLLPITAGGALTGCGCAKAEEQKDQSQGFASTAGDSETHTTPF